MLSTNPHAFRYDIPIFRAAADIEPVLPISSKSAAFPGPKATVAPISNRIRGAGMLLQSKEKQ
jgi:hypothetical protein